MRGLPISPRLPESEESEPDDIDSGEEDEGTLAADFEVDESRQEVMFSDRLDDWVGQDPHKDDWN